MTQTSLQQLLNEVPEHVLDGIGWKHFNIPKGQRLFQQGDPVDRVWVLQKGQVRVLVDGVQVGDVGPGESLGEAAIFFTGERRSASCVARTDVDAWVLERSSLDQLRNLGGDFYDRMLDGALAETWERL